MARFVQYPHPALETASVARPVDAEMRRVSDELLAAATAVEAYGLAAAHIGSAEPLVVVSFAENWTTRDYRILFNPVVIEVADIVEAGAEGSVSMPGVEVPVERPVWAVIEYQDGQGATERVRLEGFPARVALHEIEQTRGVFFLSHLTRLKRDMLLRKFLKKR